MIDETCVKIVTYDNELPYLYYRFEVFWIVEKISQKPFASGYIVQEVEIINTTGIAHFDDYVHYYEAWLVKDGKCINEDSSPDDIFACGFEDIKEHLLKQSLGKTGKIEYRTKIYWIDKSDKNYETIENWKEGTVKQAGLLKSEYYDSCNDFSPIAPICERPLFVHKVNFAETNVIKQALIELFKSRVDEKDEFLQYDLEDLLYQTPYAELTREICVENKLPYDDI